MNTKKHGFTLVELTLVLGIAGLIFVMAFIALPNLWASERDSERRTTVMDFISTLKNYQTNNSRGAIPILDTTNSDAIGPVQFSLTEARKSTSSNDWQAFVRDYISKDFGDPGATEDDINFYVVECLNREGNKLNVSEPCEYKADGLALVNADGGSTTDVNYTFYVGIGATCDGDRLVKSSSGRSVATLYILERTGRYCYNT